MNERLRFRDWLRIAAYIAVMGGTLYWAATRPPPTAIEQLPPRGYMR